jgi:hypothetical protein
MATRIAWLLNLDADEELADPRHYRVKPELEARIAALVPRMSMLLRPDDLVLPGSGPVPGDLTVLTFCPTPSALARVRALGAKVAFALPHELLRSVNGRSFCAALGQTLPHARYVRDMAELEAAIRAPSPSGAFLLKREFSFAGRERRQARHLELDASTRGFAARSFARGEGLQVEPLLELLAEFALHGFVLGGGRWLTGPLVAQDCDRQGRWLGSRLSAPDALSASEQAALEAELTRVASALGDLGYVGPFGVDAHRYRDARGRVAFQPRSEINARFTMGYPRELLARALAATSGAPAAT